LSSVPFVTQGPGADLIGKDMLGILIVQCERYAPRITVGSPQIRECMGARENVAARKLIFVTTSTCTSEAIHAGEIGRSRGWLTMIDGSRLFTIITACWERLPGHWQARLVGQEQS
jgi:restriction endonuclease Mrr